MNPEEVLLLAFSMSNYVDVVSHDRSVQSMFEIYTNIELGIPIQFYINNSAKTTNMAPF